MLQKSGSNYTKDSPKDLLASTKGREGSHFKSSSASLNPASNKKLENLNSLFICQNKFKTQEASKQKDNQKTLIQIEQENFWIETKSVESFQNCIDALVQSKRIQSDLALPLKITLIDRLELRGNKFQKLLQRLLQQYGNFRISKANLSLK